MDIHAEATIVQETDRISRRNRLDFVTLPGGGFVSNFHHEILVIGSVCVTLFTRENEVGDEAILECFNRG
jgi:hypothetical protein